MFQNWVCIQVSILGLGSEKLSLKQSVVVGSQSIVKVVSRFQAGIGFQGWDLIKKSGSQKKVEVGSQIIHQSCVSGLDLRLGVGVESRFRSQSQISNSLSWLDATISDSKFISLIECYNRVLIWKSVPRLRVGVKS